MKNIFLLFYLLSSSLCAGQDMNAKGLFLGLYGDNYTNPGVHIGYEIPMTSTKIISWRDALKSRNWATFFSPAIKVYLHEGVHIGLILLPEFGARMIYSSGFKLEGFGGVGYHRSFVTATTYKQNSSGAFNTVPFAGQNTWLFHLGTGIGYDYRKRKNKPFALSLRLGINVRTPHNGTLLPALTSTVGGTHFFQKTHHSSSKAKRL